MDGTAQEQDFLRVLDHRGWEGVRAPASGTAPRNQPDVIASKRGFILIGELKAGGPPRNLERHEVRALREFALAFHAVPVIGIRYKGERAFYLTLPSKLDRTDQGRYSTKTKPDSVDWGVRVDYDKEKDEDGDVICPSRVSFPDGSRALGDTLTSWLSQCYGEILPPESSEGVTKDGN